jgi:hypothetical protein
MLALPGRPTVGCCRCIKPKMMLLGALQNKRDTVGPQPRHAGQDP